MAVLSDQDTGQHVSVSKSAQKGNGASGYGAYLNSQQQRDGSPEDNMRGGILPREEDDDAVQLRVNNNAM
jgi:hypothetical protein